MVSCFLGWRADSTLHLTVGAVQFGFVNDIIFVDVTELKGKNIRPGKL